LRRETNGPIEIITGREGRRRWSVADKLRIVAETREPGARVVDVAARHGVYQSLLFTWRRQAREGTLALPGVDRFVAVRLRPAAPSEDPAEPASARPLGDAAAKLIEIEFKDGSRVRVGSDIGLAAQRRVVTALRG
jgi:transposase